MEERTFRTDLTEKLGDEIVSIARTSVGDSLRSVVYFSPSQFDVIYNRQDLYNSPDAVRKAKGKLVEFERLGFAEAPIRSAASERSQPSTIGSYEFTVRFHKDGFVVRVVEGDHGILLTTDSMNVAAFEEAVSAFKRLLGGE